MPSPSEQIKALQKQMEEATAQLKEQQEAITALQGEATANAEAVTKAQEAKETAEQQAAEANKAKETAEQETAAAKAEAEKANGSREQDIAAGVVGATGGEAPLEAEADENAPASGGDGALTPAAALKQYEAIPANKPKERTAFAMKHKQLMLQGLAERNAAAGTAA